jgi:hypothetical protein
MAKGDYYLIRSAWMQKESLTGVQPTLVYREFAAALKYRQRVSSTAVDSLSQCVYQSVRPDAWADGVDAVGGVYSFNCV